jgi:N6-adenosine-specific RNA methylase IME4
MELEQITALPVKELADKDAILFLWTTLPMIQEALQVIKAWGFEYKTTAFAWVKLARHSNGIFWGLGYWTRSNVEICMLATKGHPKRVAKNIHQVIISHVEEHSKKPAEARRRIEALMGDVPKIELFARRPARGWDVWGNEVVSDIVMKENDGINCPRRPKCVSP